MRDERRCRAAPGPTAAPKRHQHARPRPRARAARPRPAPAATSRVRRLRASASRVRLDPLGQRPRGALRQRQRARSLGAARRSISIWPTVRAVALEGRGGLVEKPRLLAVGRVLPQADQVCAQPVAALAPRRRRSADRARTRNRASSRAMSGIASRTTVVRRSAGTVSRGDLAIHRDQAADGAQAEDAHRGEHHDDQRGRQEDLRGESHALSFFPSARLCRRGRRSQSSRREPGE